MKKLYINAREGIERIAVVHHDELVEVLVGESGSIVGNVYIGRVAKVLKGMNAAFVDIGLEKNAYIHRNDCLSFYEAKNQDLSISQCVHEGQYLIVSVMKDEVDGKGAKVTQRIELTGKYAAYMPYDNVITVSRKIRAEAVRASLVALGESVCESGEGIIFRSSCSDAAEETVRAEILGAKERLLSFQHQLQSAKKTTLLHDATSFIDRIEQKHPLQTVTEIYVDSLAMKKQLEDSNVHYYSGSKNIFAHYEIEDKIEKALKKVVWLKNGSYILIEHTEAMTVIDVNTGKFVGKQTLQDTVLKTNELAAIEIAKQLRLRNIGGMILIDFINMQQEEDKARIVSIFNTHLRKDRTPSKVFGFTALGILEMTRKRNGKSLREMVFVQCGTCHGSGDVVSPEEMFKRLERELWEHKGMDHEAVFIEASPSVKKYVDAHQASLEESLSFRIFIKEVVGASPTYSIRYFGSVEEMMDRLG